MIIWVLFRLPEQGLQPISPISPASAYLETPLKRRTFITAMALASLTPTLRAYARPRVLILGGTRFLGRAMAEEALRQNLQLSLFHRGKTGAELFPEAEHILGDRNGPLEVLKGREFDLILDTSGQLPAQVEATVKLFPQAHYIFISSISAYSDHSQLRRDEEATLTPTQGLDLTQELPANYGARKVACELLVRQHPSATILRPCLIVGPHDPSDRFTYWVARGAGWGGDWGETLLAPGTPQDPIQWIDVRDLANWSLTLGLARRSGIFNAVGPAQTCGLGSLTQAVAPDRPIAWIPADFLQSQRLQPWKDLPAWVPPGTDSAGFTTINNQRALKAGLKLRDLDQTVSDTLAWRRQQPQPLAAGLTPEREREVLAAWANR